MANLAGQLLPVLIEWTTIETSNRGELACNSVQYTDYNLMARNRIETKALIPTAAKPRLFRGIRRESSSDKVYNAIREAIVAGHLSTGARITEQQLAREFEVSRIVIRETLQHLANDGLVVQNSYKGTFVVKLEPPDVDEIISIRAILEQLAVRQARQRFTNEDKALLRRMAKTLERASRYTEEYAQLDHELHGALWQMSGNQRLVRLLWQVTAPLFAMGTIVRYSKAHDGERRDAHSAEHIELVESICGSSDERAEQAVQDHLFKNWSIIRTGVGDFIQKKSGTAKRKPKRSRGPQLAAPFS